MNSSLRAHMPERGIQASALQRATEKQPKESCGARLAQCQVEWERSSQAQARGSGVG